MDTSELLRKAWEAVEQSGVPESLHEAAFQEAVEDLRSGGAPEAKKGGGRPHGGKRTSHGASATSATAAADEKSTEVDEETFFARLAAESGVPEADLRDVLSLTGGNVHITQPTRTLGSTRAEQAKTTIALVAGARAFGLNERPVGASPVRHELERKGCYDGNNFAAKHLGPLTGFNAGANRNLIVTTSKWVKEFSAAVDQALGRNKEPKADQKG